ncbi:MAG: metallophosphoesterase [Niabella sp.]
MNRRKFIRNIGVMAGFCGLYSWKVEPYWLDVEQVLMPVENLPEKLVGKTLMQISDIHVGNGFNIDFLIRFLQKAKTVEPDFVVYTGDFVTWHNNEQLKDLNKVLQHAVKGKIATVGILGNHDYGYNWRQNSVAATVCDVATNNDIIILRNEVKDFEGLYFTGFEDYWSDKFDYSLMKTVDNTKANIVLCHNPDACDEDIWHEYKGWILAGHTHGGQVRILLLQPIVPVNNKKYTSGKINLQDGRFLYINKGLSTSHYFRFGVRPEITIFKLQKI